MVLFTTQYRIKISYLFKVYIDNHTHLVSKQKLKSEHENLRNLNWELEMPQFSCASWTSPTKYLKLRSPMYPKVY